MRLRRIRRQLPPGWTVEPGRARLDGSADYVLLDTNRRIRGAIARDWKRSTWYRTTWTGWVPFGSWAKSTADLGALTTQLVALADNQTEQLYDGREVVFLSQPQRLGQRTVRLSDGRMILPDGRVINWPAFLPADTQIVVEGSEEAEGA